MGVSQCSRGDGGRRGVGRGKGVGRSGVSGVFEAFGPVDSSMMGRAVESCRRDGAVASGPRRSDSAAGLPPAMGAARAESAAEGREVGSIAGAALIRLDLALSSRGDGVGCDGVAESVRCVGDAA